MDAFAWIGQLLLLTCSVPQAVMSVKKGHSNGLSGYMIWLWGSGMFFSLIYFIMTLQVPAIINYSFSLLVWCVIAWYYHFPRKTVSP